MNTRRNRTEGWKHAKLSGHENETLIESRVKYDGDVQDRLLVCGGFKGKRVASVDVGGLREKDVNCILGGKTKSKTDMHLYMSDGHQINVSIKKSAGGQVFLIGIDRFIEGFEAQFHKQIPSHVKRAISLFWGTAEDTIDIASKYGNRNKAYELRKHRLVEETLRAYDQELSAALLDWFNENIKEIFFFCFSSGLAANENEWADIVWYRNELKESDMDDMFNINEVMTRIRPTAEYGNRTGGSTIQFPFGFVQWHSPTNVIPGCMQFHHSLEKICNLMK